MSDGLVGVLIALPYKFNILDFSGPLKVLKNALDDLIDEDSFRFYITLAGAEPGVLCNEGAVINSQITFREAHDRLEEFDILVIPGGDTAEILNRELEPLGIIDHFVELQKKDLSHKRTLFSVSSGSLLLAQLNQLSGLSATAHPDFIVQLKSLCSEAASQYQTQPANVIEKAGYVVCHNTKSPDRLRIITTDGPSSGIDAALYIVSTFVHSESAAEVAKSMLWTKGNGIIDDGLGT